MPESIIIVGAGGFGRKILDVIDAINANSRIPTWRVMGVVDDAPSPENRERLAVRGIEILGTLDDALAWKRSTAYVVGIGNPVARRRVSARFDSANFQARTVIHPSATIGAHSLLGAGSVICAGARLDNNVQVGRHCHINHNAIIGHEAILGDFVSMSPLAAVAADCVIHDEVLVGLSGVVLNGVTISRGATVGACACVVKDVPQGVIVKGVPAI